MGILGKDLHVYWGNLPHWRASGATYFLTWRLRPQVPDLDPGERRMVTQAINHHHLSKYRLHVWVVMNDHVHALLTPKQGFTLEQIVRAWKSFTSRSLNKQRGTAGPLWQEEYFDRIIRDEAEFLEKSTYILGNPFKRWPELTEYAWVGVETV